MSRVKLPQRRRSTNVTFKYQRMSIEMQMGFYEDGRLGEIFFNTYKTGSTIDTLLRDVALTVSIALQYGATIEELAASATRNENGSPDGILSVIADTVKMTLKE